ncbi:MAG: HYR domain-containing protein, partial [Acidobacteriota bacterium]|nr:HYR domain-containing protein [Acidobacteriota bacterium]
MKRFQAHTQGRRLSSENPRTNIFTKRAFALSALFSLLAVIGWQLPGWGKTAVEYSRSVFAARTSTPDAAAVIPVTIEVLPGQQSKSIDLSSTGNLGTAILGSANFDVATIAPASLKLSGAPIIKQKTPSGSAPKSNQQSDIGGNKPVYGLDYFLRDINNDNRQDLVFFVSIPYLAGLTAGTRTITLTGRTIGGDDITGSQTVQVSGVSIIRGGGSPGSPSQFCNPNPITINDNAPANPYPSSITVSGMSNLVSKVTVSLTGLSHSFADDVSILLVAPNGNAIELMSDTGGINSLTNVNLTFDDAAANYLPNTAAFVSGTFKPTRHDFEDIFEAPAPQTTIAAPYGATLGHLNGINPNGTWQLFVRDQAGGDTGMISGGWCLTITTTVFGGCTSQFVTGSIGNGDAVQTPRMLRDEITSQCGTPKTCPGAIGTDNHRFETFTFTNQSVASQCVTVTLSNDCGINLFASAYLGTYAPPPPGANVCLNYLGDNGTSFGGLGLPFSFDVPAGATFVVVVNEIGPTGCNNFSLLVEGSLCQLCTSVTCPTNITTNNTPGQCGANVNYSAPVDPVCGAITCLPASGSFFPLGTTTVTCNSVAGPSCNFTVTVNDMQPPTITCPANVFVGTTSGSTTVTFPAPAVGDNCPGIQTPSCTPASGSSFPVGLTTVTCSVNDAANNSASCSFTVTVNRVSGAINDPLACTGPGNTVQVTLNITNNGNVNQTVANTTTFTNLVGNPGSCTTNVGACNVTNAGMTFSGTLSPGQTVTINYLAQVSDLAAPGAQVCANNSVTFNGGAALNFSACRSITCPAVGPGGILPATSEASDQKAGSVLIYNVYTSSTDPTKQNTRINITNVHLTRSAFVHLFFVAEGCAIADSYICLTGNQTASFLASDLDPGTTGYLVAVAVDGIRGCPISFNYLIGDEYVKFNSGHAANLGAIAFSQIAGGLPACDGNSVTAQLNFDGTSYNRTPATLALSNVGSRADGNDTLLILNRIGGNLGIGASSLGTLFGILYDDAENALSFNVTGGCQLRSSLSNNFPRTTPRFETFIPAGRTGWLKVFNQTGAIGMTGAAINFNANA